MTPPRQRFSDDLRLRNTSPKTIEACAHAVAKFARHYNKRPELLGPEQIRDYQLHLIKEKVSWSQFNQCVCALRFLYNTSSNGRTSFAICLSPNGHASCPPC